MDSGYTINDKQGGGGKEKVHIECERRDRKTAREKERGEEDIRTYESPR